jgi:hypothetical protein
MVLLLRVIAINNTLLIASIMVKAKGSRYKAIHAHGVRTSYGSGEHGAPIGLCSRT